MLHVDGQRRDNLLYVIPQSYHCGRYPTARGAPTYQSHLQEKRLRSKIGAAERKKTRINRFSFIVKRKQLVSKRLVIWREKRQGGEKELKQYSTRGGNKRETLLRDYLTPLL